MSYISKPWVFLEQDYHDEEEFRCRPLTIGDFDNNDLAIIFSNEDSTVGQSRADAVAAAKLIAAAPEIYVALANIVESIEADGVARHAYAPAVQQAKAALEKVA